MTNTEDPVDNNQQEPNLDLQDLGKLLNLVDTAIKHGAYERSELYTVLDVANKLEIFLRHQEQLLAEIHAQDSTDNQGDN